MWKFQLRKENAVLLEGQEAQQKILQALAAESTKTRKDFDERYSALEARISNLEHDERKDRHAFETWGGEMATLKSQIATVMEKQERLISEGIYLPVQTRRDDLLMHSSSSYCFYHGRAFFSDVGCRIH